MSDIAIHVDNLSKQYRIGGPQVRYRTLRDSLVEAMGAPLRRLSAVVRGQSSAGLEETIWALKDASFEVKRGEVVGIIGRNGAGKSTLLKILSRITEPTEGEAEIVGRVGSLLEVGTGFHPELTGRENIYLNGAILGMKRAEIDGKFDEIVAFSEIAKFLDTPVKHYSSGMYVRLAFAVAAHLEPEIMLVDEVLAVGDAAFQKKCLGKMGEVSREGRTVLLVSHQMTMIRNLSTRCILLESGRIAEIGLPSDIIAGYFKRNMGSSVTTRAEWVSSNSDSGKRAAPYVIVKRFALVDEEGRAQPSVLDASQSAYIQVEGRIDREDSRLCVGFCLLNDLDDRLMISYQTDQPEQDWPRLSVGSVKIRAKLDLGILNEGRYRVVLICGLHCVKMFYEDSQTEILFAFEVSGNQSHSPYWVGRRDTLLAPSIKWTLVQ